MINLQKTGELGYVLGQIYILIDKLLVTFSLGFVGSAYKLN